MALLSYLLSFLIMVMVIPYSACYRISTLQEEKHLLLGKNINGPREPHLNSYFRAIDDGGKLKSLIKEPVDVLSLKGFPKLTSNSHAVKTVNVDDFGAKGDGTTDDSKAFQKAWKSSCSSKEPINILIYKKIYLLKPIIFSGPCKSKLTLLISGTLEASSNPSDYSQGGTYWLRFEDVQNMSVRGGGTLNGNGGVWWERSCKINPKLPCKDAPTAMTFYNSNNLVVQNLKIQDAQQIHVTFEDCNYVRVRGLRVTSPEESPNTDGIHITNTQNIEISNCVIGTGDDCVSIVNGSKNLRAINITCGPGHGISIGSLGSANSTAYVSGITVNGANISGTLNGVRIKTWQGGSGTASNIKFKNIKMTNVTNPIIIDQSYCDQDKPCEKERSAVQISNVLYEGIKGTSASDVAVTFNCSRSFPCKGIRLVDIELKTQEGGVAQASCHSVELEEVEDASPRCP